MLYSYCMCCMLLGWIVTLAFNLNYGAHHSSMQSNQLDKGLQALHLNALI